MSSITWDPDQFPQAEFGSTSAFIQPPRITKCDAKSREGLDPDDIKIEDEKASFQLEAAKPEAARLERPGAVR